MGLCECVTTSCVDTHHAHNSRCWTYVLACNCWCIYSDSCARHLSDDVDDDVHSVSVVDNGFNFIHFRFLCHDIVASRAVVAVVVVFFDMIGCWYVGGWLQTKLELLNEVVCGWGSENIERERDEKCRVEMARER